MLRTGALLGRAAGSAFGAGGVSAAAASLALSSVVTCRKTSSRLMRIGRSSSSPQPRVTIVARQLAADVASVLALDLERAATRGRMSAAATRVTPGTRRQRRRAASAPGASTCTYSVSAPRSRAVRLSGVSTATTRPLLMMTTRWQVCDDLRKDVRAQHDRVVAGEAANQIARLDDLLRVEAGGRLVEDQHVRVVDDRLRQADALPVALRELAAVPVGHVGDARALHHRVDARLALAATARP